MTFLAGDGDGFEPFESSVALDGRPRRIGVISGTDSSSLTDGPRNAPAMTAGDLTSASGVGNSWLRLFCDCVRVAYICPS